jgi:hypothetical protein
MAVGQLFSYSYRLDKKMGFDLCVLVPEKPLASDAMWLEELEIGLMWFSGPKLKTDCYWLTNLA